MSEALAAATATCPNAPQSPGSSCSRPSRSHSSAITTYLLTRPIPTPPPDQPPTFHPPRTPRAHRLAAVTTAIGALLLIGLPWGAIPAALALYAIPRALSRLEPTATRQRTAQITRDLPLAVDLLTACLRAGRPPQQALSLVANRRPRPTSRPLHQGRPPPRPRRRPSRRVVPPTFRTSLFIRRPSNRPLNPLRRTALQRPSNT